MSNLIAKERKGNGHALAPYGGFGLLGQMRTDFDRLFDRWFQGWPTFWPEETSDQRWGMEVKDENGKVVIRAETPGFEAGDFDLQAKGDQLVLHAAKKTEAEEKDRDYQEVRQQEYYRSVSLPSGVVMDKAEASYRNGILTVTIPKKEEAKARKIPVKG